MNSALTIWLQEKHGSEKRAVILCKKVPSAATRFRQQYSVLRSRPVALTSDEQWLISMAWEMMQHEFRGKPPEINCLQINLSPMGIPLGAYCTQNFGVIMNKIFLAFSMRRFAQLTFFL
jgi:hypothetical protein